MDATIAQVIADLQEVKGYTSQQAYNLVYNGGLTIETAQDPAVQQIMDEETSNEDNYPAGSQDRPGIRADGGEAGRHPDQLQQGNDGEVFQGK